MNRFQVEIQEEYAKLVISATLIEVRIKIAIFSTLLSVYLGRYAGTGVPP